MYFCILKYIVLLYLFLTKYPYKPATENGPFWGQKCSVLVWNVSYAILQYCIVLHCISLYHMVYLVTVWYWLLMYCIALYSMVSYGTQFHCFGARAVSRKTPIYFICFMLDRRILLCSSVIDTNPSFSPWFIHPFNIVLVVLVGDIQKDFWK